MLNDKEDLKKHFKQITIFETNSIRDDFISYQIQNKNKNLELTCPIVEKIDNNGCFTFELS